MEYGDEENFGGGQVDSIVWRLKGACGVQMWEDGSSKSHLAAE